MKTIAFNATKGGTGKSTLSIVTLNALTAMGYKCLAVDADVINHSLSFSYNTGIPFEVIQAKNVFNAFSSGNITDNIIPIHERLDLLHGDVRLSNFRSTDALKRLKKILSGIEGYDFCVIDTSPTYDNITANVFFASDYLVIPIIADQFNYQSLKFLVSEKLAELELPALNMAIVINQFERARTQNKEVFNNQVVELFQSDPLLSHFIANAKISRSSVIKKCTNCRSFRINDREATAKQFLEIKNFLNEIFHITLTAEEI